MTDVESTLRHALTAEPAELDRLRVGLAAAAARDDLLDVAFTSVDSPVGRLLLAATPLGLVRVAYEREGEDAVLDALSARISARILRAPARLDVAARQLEEYFARRRTRFDLRLDRSLSAGFRGRVQQHLPDIPYGATRTYQQVAVSVGSPNAVRAVGSACATNPLPIVVPCHRVLRSDGTLGGYIGGLEAKTALLALEA